MAGGTDGASPSPRRFVSRAPVSFMQRSVPQPPGRKRRVPEEEKARGEGAAGAAGAAPARPKRVRGASAAALEAAANAAAAAARGTAADGPGAGRTRAPPPPAPSARQEVNAAVARRRAMHFARFRDDEGDDEDGEDDSEGGNVHAGARNARACELGMWATARDLEANKAKARKRRLSSGGAAAAEGEPVDARAEAWRPREHGELRVYGPGRVERVPPLFDMCCRFLCDHVEHVASFDGLPDPVRVKLSAWLSRRKLLQPEFVRLVTEGAPTDVRLGDSSLLPEESLCEPLANALKPGNPLASLHLGHCGRGMSDKLLKSLFEPSAEGARGGSLTSLKLHGAYRVGDKGVLAALEGCPVLEEVEFSFMPRLTCAVWEAVKDGMACAATLRDVCLKGCEGVGDDAGALLAALPQLTRIDISTIYGVSDAFFAALLAGELAAPPRLEAVRAAACAQLSDATLQRLREACGATLAELDVSETAITDAGLAMLMDDAAGATARPPPPRLVALQMGRCRGVKKPATLVRLWRACCESTLASVGLAAVPAVNDAAVVELATACATSLRDADLAFCRAVSDGALGLLADTCRHLDRLSLYGNTQTTEKFLQGHRNARVDVRF